MMGKGKPRSEEKLCRKPTQRQRLFTNEYALGQEVAIIRSEHGWFDGSAGGIITIISEYYCEVTDEDGITYTINHPRDIIG
jgi:hypothetical protein